MPDNYKQLTHTAEEIDKAVELANANATEVYALKNYAMQVIQTELNGLKKDKADAKTVEELKEDVEKLDKDAENKYTKSEVDEKLNDKVEKIEGKGLSANDFSDEYKNKINKNTEDLENTYRKSEVDEKIGDKVDKIEGKGLSTNDFDNKYKSKIDNTYTKSEINSIVETVEQKTVDNASEIEQLKSIKADKSALDETNATVAANKANLQGQIDALVVEAGGDSNPEVVQARIGSDGTAHNTLKARLDNMETKAEEEITGVKNDLNIIDNITNALSRNTKVENIPITNWSVGWIDPNTGVDDTYASHKDFARSDNYFNITKGLKYTVSASVSQSVKIFACYYDANKNFKKNAQIGVDNGNVDSSYDYFRIQVCYESGEDMSIDDIISNIVIKSSLVINNAFKSLPEVGMITNSAVDINFNDLSKGVYYISCDTSHDLLNAPNGDKRGIYTMIAVKAVTLGSDDYILQIAFCDGNAENTKAGMSFRLYNKTTGVNAVNWTELKKSSESETTTTPNTTKTDNNYMAIGDSITYGFLPGNQRASLPYPTVVGKILGLNTVYGAQTGAGFIYPNGEITAHSIIDYWVEHSGFAHYDVMTIAFGTNDYGNNMELGTIDDMYPTNDTVCGSINYCIKRIYDNAPNINLIFITPINATDKGTKETNYRYGTPNDKGYTLKDLCNKIVEICERDGINYIDNSKSSVINSINVDKTGVLSDKLHPAESYYRILGQYYAGRIGSFFQANVTSETE